MKKKLADQGGKVKCLMIQDGDTHTNLLKPTCRSLAMLLTYLTELKKIDLRHTATTSQSITSMRTLNKVIQLKKQQEGQEANDDSNFLSRLEEISCVFC